jgi:hypothetical protein
MSTDDVRLLFKQFVELRQAGYGRNDAWFEIEETVRSLPQIDQKRLTSMLQQWEKQIATKSEALANRPKDPHDTKEQPDGWAQAAQHAADERRRNVIRRIAPTDGSTQDVSDNVPVGHGIPCPQCGKMNKIKAVYCYSCGMPMGAATTANATRPLAGTEPDSAYFDETMILYLKAVGGDSRIQVDPSMHETILGRKTADSVMIPDVDLSPFEAGEHLHAHEVRVLHDGDEIRLGRLIMHIFFAPK